MTTSLQPGMPDSRVRLPPAGINRRVAKTVPRKGQPVKLPALDMKALTGKHTPGSNGNQQENTKTQEIKAVQLPPILTKGGWETAPGKAGTDNHGIQLNARPVEAQLTNKTDPHTLSRQHLMKLIGELPSFDEMTVQPDDDKNIPPSSEIRLQSFYHLSFMDRQIERQATTLKAIGDYYMHKATEGGLLAHLLESAGLYNAALCRCQPGQLRQALHSCLREVEIAILGQSDKKKTKEGLTTTVPKRHPVDSAQRHRDSLQRLREFTSKQSLRVQLQWAVTVNQSDRPESRKHEVEFKKECTILRKKIKQELRSILMDMVKECIVAIGTLPCAYAIITLGDFAVEDCTPYTDLEFVILIDDDSTNTIEYFQRFAVYLHFKIINLGETPLSDTGVKLMTDIYFPQMESLPDYCITNGIKINSNNPTNTLKESKQVGALDDDNPSAILVRRPQDISKALSEMQLDESAAYVFHFLQATSLYGDPDLLQQTKHSIVTDFIQKQPKRIQTFCALMEEKLKTFDLTLEFRIESFEMGMQDLLDDLNMTSLLVQSTHVLYGLQAFVPGRILEELHSRLFLNENGEHDLKMAVSIAHALRCILQCYYKGQTTGTHLLSKLGKTSEHIGYDTLRDLFGFRSSSMIIRMYSSVLPIVNHFREVLRVEKGLNMLEIDFFRIDHDVRLFVYHRTHQGERFLKVLNEKVTNLTNNNKDNNNQEYAIELFDLYTMLGTYHLNIRDPSSARKYFTQAMELKEAMNDQTTRVLCFSRTWFHLGLVYFIENDLKKAESYFKESMKLFDEMTDGETVENTDPSILCFHASVNKMLQKLYQWSGRYTISLNFSQLALHYYEKLTHQKPHQKLYLLKNTGEVCLSLADYKSAHYYFKRAASECEKMFAAQRPSVQRASVFYHLGNASRGLGKNTNARLYTTAAINEFTEVLGDISDITVDKHLSKIQGPACVDVCSWLHCYAKACQASGEHDKVVSLIDKVIYIHQEYAKSGCAILSCMEESIINLTRGSSLYHLNQPENATDCFQKSVRLLRHTLKKKYKDSALVWECNRQTALSLCKQGDVQKAMRELRTVNASINIIDDYHDTLLFELQCLEDQATIYASRNEYDNALTVWQTVLDQRKQLLGQFHPLVASAHGDMGKLHKIMCNFDSAIDEFNKALHIYNKICGNHIPSQEIAETCHDIGVAYQEAGRITHAESSLLTSMRLWHEIQGVYSTKLQSVDTCISLGNFYHKVQNLNSSVQWHKKAIELILNSSLASLDIISPRLPGMILSLALDYQREKLYADSITYYEMALKMHRHNSVEEEDTLQIAQWWLDMGKAHMNLGHVDRSEQCQQNALRIRQRLLGEEKEEVEKPSSLAVLAEHFEHRGQYKKSLPLRRKALSQAKLLHGTDPHQDVIGCYKALIDVYLNVGYYGHAQRKNRELLIIFKQKYGGKVDHEELAGCHRLDGLINNGLANFDKSTQAYEEALAMYDRLGINTNADKTVMCLTEYARCLMGIGQKEKAEGYLKRAKEICNSQKKLSPCKPNVEADVHMALGWSFECYPNFSKALTSYMKAYKLYKAHYGKDAKHMKLSLCLCGMGRAYCTLDQHEPGIKRLEESVAMLIDLFGDGPLCRQEVMDAYNDLANAHLKGGDPAVSFELFSKVLLMARQKYGTERPSLQIAKHLGYVAHAARNAHEYETAIKCATEAIEIYNKILKKHGNHPDTAAMITLLGDVYYETNHLEKALKLYKDAAHIHLILHNGNVLSKEVESAMVKVRSTRKALEGQGIHT